MNRSYVERNIGQLVGIFQLDRRRPLDHSEARALPGTDGVALVAVADGGRLTETAFNAWTVASQMYIEAGCPATPRIDTSLSVLARRLWGAGGKSATLRRRVVDAVQELLRTRVVIMGIDPYTREPSPTATWELNLLEAAGVRGEMDAVYRAAREGDREALAQFASLRGREDTEGATWSIVLPTWLADSIRNDGGVVLNYEVQRTLRGAGKRIWVQLESDPGWSCHRLAQPADEREMRETVTALSDNPFATVTVEPGPDEIALEVETLVVPLDSDIYAAFGLSHANRKRDLEAACRSIVESDPTYLRAEVCSAPGSSRRFELRLARASGEQRQRLLREAIRARALGGHKEDVLAEIT